MDPDGTCWLFLALGCALGAALLTAFYHGALADWDDRLRKQTDLTGADAALARLMRAPHRTEAAVLTGTLALGFGGLLAALAAARPAQRALEAVTGGGAWFAPVWLLGAALVWSALFAALCRFFPAALGQRYSRACARGLLPVYRLLSLLALPLGLLAAGLGRALAALFGARTPKGAETVTEEEILMMVDEGGETGVIEQSQKDMIANIFEFDDTTAEDIMTHRTEIEAVERTATVHDLVEAAIRSGFSRIPVYDGDLDNIVGVVMVKDLLPLVEKNDAAGQRAADYVRPVPYVPGSVKCRDLFQSLTQKHAQLAIVVDEYGGTAGLVSMEDILESIVGNIQDEYDREEEEIRREGEDAYLVDGCTDLDDLCEELGIEIDYDDSLYDTVAGFLTDRLGFIPDDGETPFVDCGGYHFQVAQVEERRIALVRITRLPPEGEAGGGPAGAPAGQQ